MQSGFIQCTWAPQTQVSPTKQQSLHRRLSQMQHAKCTSGEPPSHQQPSCSCFLTPSTPLHTSRHTIEFIMFHIQHQTPEFYITGINKHTPGHITEFITHMCDKEFQGKKVSCVTFPPSPPLLCLSVHCLSAVLKCNGNLCCSDCLVPVNWTRHK